jgi:hypothetical protein
MEEDLRKHEEVLAEAVQLRFRRYGFDVIDELRSMLSSGLSLRDAVGELCRRYGLRADQVMPSDPLEYMGLSVEIAENVYREVMRRTGLKVGEAGGGGVEGEAA